MKISLYAASLLCLAITPFVARSNPDTAAIAHGLTIAFKIRSDDSALAEGKRLYASAVKAGYHRGQMRALNLISQREFNKGAYDSMIATLRRAIALAGLKPAGSSELPSLYNNLGIAHQTIGNYDSSLNCYYAAINYQQHYGSVISRGTPYVNLAMLLRRLARYSQAIEAIRTATAIYERDSDEANLPIAYLNLGGLYTVLRIPDSFAKARFYLEKALSNARTQRQPLVEQKALYELGLLADYSSLPAEAIRYYEAAMQIPTGNPYDDLVPVINLSKVHIGSGNYGRAGKLLEEGLQQALKISPAPDFLCDFYFHLGEVYEHAGNPQKAATSYRRYIDLSDKLWGEKLQDRVDQLQGRYEKARHDNELMRKQLVIAGKDALLRKNRAAAIIAIVGIIGLAALAFAWYERKRRRRLQVLEREKWEAIRETEELERTRIARTLHDHVAGSLTNARQWLATIGKQPVSPERDQEFQQALGLLDNAIADVRTTAHELIPAMIAKQEFAGVLESYAESVQRATGIHIDFQYLGDLGRLRQDVELTLFRCVQELLQNVARHSEASRALVQISCHQQMLFITVEDNGIGLSGSEQKSEGLGLKNIRRSIQQLGGNFILHSGKHSVTSALIELDISKYKM